MEKVIKTAHGKYLSAQPNGTFEVRDSAGEWEVFDFEDPSINPSQPPIIPPPSGYNISVGNPLNSKPFCRGAATANNAYFGEFADKRTDGGSIYAKHDRRAHLWRTDGNSWGLVTHIPDVESIHAMHPNPARDGINFATEHNAKVYSMSDNGELMQQYDFGSSRGVSIGAGNCGKYGELVACSHFKGHTKIAGYRDGAWNHFNTIHDKFVWALTEYKGFLLAGCSYNNDFYHKHAGSIFQLEPTRKLVIDPPYGFVKGFHKKNNALYAMFGRHLAWTEDLIGWPSVEMPGNSCWSMVDTGPETMIGIWYTSARGSAATGKPQGIWLVEFNVSTQKVKILKYWDAPGMNAPYYTGGGLVGLHGFAVGFFTIQGRSRSLKVTW